MFIFIANDAGYLQAIEDLGWALYDANNNPDLKEAMKSLDKAEALEIAIKEYETGRVRS